MQNLFKILFLVLLNLTFFTANSWQEPEEKDSIYVSSIGWHTGIVVPLEIFPESIWPEKHNYSEAAYLEIGWGDAQYFPNKNFNLWYALKAVFWPTPSVLLITPIYGKVESFYYNTNVAKIAVGGEQLNRLKKYLLEEFELNEKTELMPVTAGPSNGHFFKGSSSYYFPKNSNVWIARALEKTGFSLNPCWYQTTGQVVRKAGEFGELVIEKE